MNPRDLPTTRRSKWQRLLSAVVSGGLCGTLNTWVISLLLPQPWPASAVGTLHFLLYLVFAISALLSGCFVWVNWPRHPADVQPPAKVEMPRLIVCAACQFQGTGVVLTGVRHWDDVMREQLRWTYHTMLDLRIGREEQGFLDNRGKFLTREEAWKVAEASGQIRRCTSSAGPGELYSEDMW